VGRGGLIKPLAGGVYIVNEAMINDLRDGVNGKHASNLGGILARVFADESGCEAYVVDPVVVDEMSDVAKISGLKGVERKSIFHALNQRASARQVAKKIGKKYEDINLIVAHLGGGISVGAHKKGCVVDVNNALNGDGPFAPERAGTLPVEGVLDMISKGFYTPEGLTDAVSREGGMFSYLETVSSIEAEERISSGDAEAKLVIDAMIYQIAKEIGSLAAALDGDVQGIVLTGGLAKSSLMTESITKKVKFIADVHVIPGENEIEALCAGVQRVLRGEEEAKEYE
jgi:butyrate kinase